MQSPPTTLFIKNFITNALLEDIGYADHSTQATVAAGHRGRAQAKIKAEGVLAGVSVAAEVFSILDNRVQFIGHLPDGAAVNPGDIAFEVEGPVHVLLMGERLALNILQRMSGIATTTRKCVRQLHGTHCRLLDTRKTTPGFRAFEKWAVKLGGGDNHRFGLYDMIMIKDNHADFAGGLAPALQAAKRYIQTHNLSLKIEVETRTLAEVESALAEGGAHRIMLDNMPLEDMRQAVKWIAGLAETEASGNMTIERLRPVAETGVDFISMGALTHSVQSLDISLKAVKL